VAYLVGATRADLGVMVSASHNPMPDNGIKLFAAGGHKLPDEVEDEIEALIAGGGGSWKRPTGGAIGRVHDLIDGPEAYINHLVSVTQQRLEGLRVVVDCANGAASVIAPEAYEQAGAEVIAISAEPDGLNINDNCGSSYLESVRAAVIEHGAHLGIAHDGDADRCLAVTAEGDEVDGDQIMGILALAMRDAGVLTENTLVATVMSNLGLKLAMADAGVRLVETKVGDRYLLEELRNRGYALGGEQSGHIVVPEYATTGDGILTALMVMARMAETGKPLSQLASVVRRLPQVLINVHVGDRSSAASAAPVLDVAKAVEAELGGTGRVLLRPSGTEQLVRVMVEAAAQEIAQEAAERIAVAVREASPIRG
jgi:phosphoglucosamine mutase